MTDQELTEIVATKVMGWTGFRDSTPWENWDEPPKIRPIWEIDDEGSIATFSPLTSDADCMKAWDRFAKEQGWVLISYNKPDWNIDCACNNLPLGGVFNTDRRRAMVECMVKAVEG